MERRESGRRHIPYPKPAGWAGCRHRLGTNKIFDVELYSLSGSPPTPGTRPGDATPALQTLQQRPAERKQAVGPRTALRSRGNRGQRQAGGEGRHDHSPTDQPHSHEESDHRAKGPRCCKADPGALRAKPVIQTAQGRRPITGRQVLPAPFRTPCNRSCSGRLSAQDPIGRLWYASGEKQSRYHLAIKCEAWRPQISRFRRNVGKAPGPLG